MRSLVMSPLSHDLIKTQLEVFTVLMLEHQFLFPLYCGDYVLHYNVKFLHLCIIIVIMLFNIMVCSFYIVSV